MAYTGEYPPPPGEVTCLTQHQGLRGFSVILLKDHGSCAEIDAHAGQEAIMSQSSRNRIYYLVR